MYSTNNILHLEHSNQLIVFGSSSFLGRSMPLWFQSQFSEILSFNSSECDLTDPESVDQVIHLCKTGAFILFISAVNKGIDNSKTAYLKNLKMAENVSRIAIGISSSGLIFTSSVDVYGQSSKIPIDENTLLFPDSWYGRAKLESELILRTVLGGKTPLVIFRCPGLYNLNSYDISVVSQFVSLARRNKTIVLLNGGCNLRDFVHTNDLFCLFLHWLKNPCNGVWNAVSGVSVSMIEVAEAIIDILESGQIKIEFSGSRNFDLVFDNELLKVQFGTVIIRPFLQILPTVLSR